MAEIARFANLNYRISNQEKDLGFKTLTVSPMRKVLRTIGNDFLTPFRTYGGVAGIDRVVKEVYNNTDPDKLSEKLYNLLKKWQS